MAGWWGVGACDVALFLGWNFLEMLCYAIFASACAFCGGIFGGWLEGKVGVKRALALEILAMIVVGLVQLSITRDSLFLGLVENVVVWDGLVFRTLSDLVYLGLISVIAVTATASRRSCRSRKQWKRVSAQSQVRKLVNCSSEGGNISPSPWR